MPKVLAGVVTYNRLPLLKRCIEHLKNQTFQPDILIINNASPDGTKEYLEQENILHINQDNVGSAGGWARAIEYAIENDYTYIWLMDDDGFAHKDALKKLLARTAPYVSCISSVVVKENEPGEFVFGLPILNKKGFPVLISSKRKYQKLDEIEKKEIYPFAHLFNGALISVAAIKKIGNVNRSFFMYGDEVEYFCRLREVGEVLTNFEALHFHPDVGKRKIENNRVYYFIRNTIYLNNKYFDKAVVRNVFTVCVALYRIMKSAGIVGMMSYIIGKNHKFVYKAIIDANEKGLQNRY